MSDKLEQPDQERTKQPIDLAQSVEDKDKTMPDQKTDAEELAEGGIQMKEEKQNNKCKGLLGWLFGHKFRPVYTQS